MRNDWRSRRGAWDWFGALIMTHSFVIASPDLSGRSNLGGGMRLPRFAHNDRREGSGDDSTYVLLVDKQRRSHVHYTKVPESGTVEGKTMKSIAKKAIRDEKGGALVLTLVLLLVGGLIIAPLLGFMGTGLIAGQVHEKRMDELYAADAGVESAIWGIQNDQAEFDENGYCSYPDNDVDPPWMINDKGVAVEIWRTEIEGSTSCHKVFKYHIRSTAADPSGSATTVDAFVTSTDLDFSDLSGNAITSAGNVTVLGQTCSITGDILLPEEGTLDVPGGFQHEDGQVIREELIWPDEDELMEFYLQDIRSGTHYYEDTVIDLEGQHLELGPLYVEGKLDIVNSVNTPATLTLTGTIYATGDTSIGQSHTLVINLNGETIFVASQSRKPPQSKEALYVKGRCGVDGPGALIAVGDIHFEPDIEAGTTDPVLVYSVSGKVHVWPKGDFYGSVVGKAEVHLQPSNTIVYPGGGFGQVNFPGLIEGKEIYSVDSWQLTTIVPDSA